MPGKPRELLRVGLREPMHIVRLRKVLELAEARDSDTIRYYNGNLIIETERPATTEDGQ